MRSVVLSVVLVAQAAAPPALQQLADAERAFARRATVIHPREAFIEFFADESVSFEPDPSPARENLRKSTWPKEMQLLWEPRVGDIAASGDLGYLTGPSETIVPGRPARYGNYFSVWKRQPDGEFRVILDVGVSMPEKPAFEPGFRRAKPIAMWKGKESKSAAEANLLAADKTFSAAIAAQGAGPAYTKFMHPNARFMRQGYQSMTTRGAATDWLAAHVKSWSTEPMKSEAAASGDLGYTWGKYNVTPTDRAASSGYYVRVWTRNRDGSWQVAAEVMTPPPPAKQ